MLVKGIQCVVDKSLLPDACNWYNLLISEHLSNNVVKNQTSIWDPHLWITYRALSPEVAFFKAIGAARFLWDDQYQDLECPAWPPRDIVKRTLKWKWNVGLYIVSLLPTVDVALLGAGTFPGSVMIGFWYRMYMGPVMKALLTAA